MSTKNKSAQSSVNGFLSKASRRRLCFFSFSFGSGCGNEPPQNSKRSTVCDWTYLASMVAVFAGISSEFPSDAVPRARSLPDDCIAEHTFLLVSNHDTSGPVGGCMARRGPLPISSTQNCPSPRRSFRDFQGQPAGALADCLENFCCSRREPP